MDLPMKAKVYAGDEACGESVCIVLNPTSKRVTDLVVRLFDAHDKQVLVALNHIQEVSEDEIRLDLKLEQVRKLTSFQNTDFFEVEEPVEINVGPYVMWPYVVPETHWIPVETEMIPFNELAIHRGSSVISTQGPVGKVDEFLIDPTSEKVTHLVLREGHLWGQRDVLIPISAISHMDEDEVKLQLDKEQIEALPQIPIHRDYHWSRAKG
jgi:uncharacterized protein YrrD